MNFAEIVKSSPDGLTPEQREKLHKEQEDREFASYLAWKEAQWLKLCPRIYIEPLNYAKLDSLNHAKVKAIVAWKSYPRGMFIIGPTGRGKTRATWAAIRSKWWNGATVKHISAFKMAQHATKALTDHENGDKVIGAYVAADILFLDDLGKRQTPALTQFLFEIIERRTSDGKPIIATSNEDYRTLAEKIDDGSGTMSEPIIRRLEEFCDLVVLP